MSSDSTNHVDQHGVSYDRKRLFWASVMALVTAGMAFSIRGSINSDLQKAFFDMWHKTDATTLVGGATASAFLGFAAAIFFGSPLCDTLGMGKLLALSAKQACILFLQICRRSMERL